MSVDPIRYFQVQNQVCPLKTACASPGVANNNSIIAAVTGQIIYVMGLIAQSASTTTIGSFNLKDGSGGTVKLNTLNSPLAVGIPFLLPIIDSGYFGCTVTTGLFSDVVTTGQLLTIFYITYIP